jgi:hypothetical protein
MSLDKSTLLNIQKIITFERLLFPCRLYANRKRQMLVRHFFTLSGNGFGPDFLRHSRIRLPLTVVIIVISFSSSIKPKRSSFSSRQPSCLVSNPLSGLCDGLFLPIFSDFFWPDVRLTSL